MKSSRRGQWVKHLTEEKLEQAITDAQKADETRLVRRLCYIRISIKEIRARRQASASDLPINDAQVGLCVE